MNKNKIEIQLFKSPIGSSKKQKQILNSLGLKKINQIITKYAVSIKKKQSRKKSRSKVQ